MRKLLWNGEPVPTVFDLLGDKENDMTAALGFVLSRSPVLTKHLLADLVGYRGSVDTAQVRLQTHTGKGGITDVEIIVSDQVAIVFEAKRGSNLPTTHQVKKYAGMLRSSGATSLLLVALTNASDAFAKEQLDREVDGIKVVHIRWRKMQKLASKSRKEESHHGKRVLDEFVSYLDGVTQMETKFSNVPLRGVPRRRQPRPMEAVVDRHRGRSTPLLLPRRQAMARPAELHRVPISGSSPAHPPCGGLRTLHQPPQHLPRGAERDVAHPLLLQARAADHPAARGQGRQARRPQQQGVVHARHLADLQDRERRPH
jgi:hypothetical protein